MKKILLNTLIIGAVAISACNSGSSDKTEASQDSSKATTETPASADKELKVINAKFIGVDPKVTGSIKEMIEHYVHLKNALANDDAKEAGTAAEALNEAYAKTDPSTLTAEQKAVLKDIGDDLKEHAEHIAKKTGDIAHQREHFAMLSEDMYGIVTSFGAGKTLYHDHCPMYNDNKGALWLSESKEIKNPYYGSKMLKCGEIKEVIK